ncbi:winged helix DNA-binding protein [Microbaculum marinisediminis]|uniref:Winged helix DNA-binding protein n=1 Tax=Microbaculum marinisediminis TaxID=2931392 RepID=A0AAW5QZT1_9HYPH|nr:winged helix DNA-binding protein [Microbaculum sp. A6E488]MCT8972565.1 winged helix DNA-binding protein [Microbaculum sp. A6E488]
MARKRDTSGKSETGSKREASGKREMTGKQAAAEQAGFDRRWHLAETPAEVDMTELEFAVMRTFESFGRWQSECLAGCIDFAASGPENALLHVIRMNDRPKSVKELARLMNRDDIPNIQYSLRKLIAAGLVERSGTARTGVSYSVTPLGHEVTETFAEIRRALLIAAIESVPGFADRLADATRTLNLLTGIYEEVSRVAATHRRPRDGWAT